MLNTELAGTFMIHSRPTCHKPSCNC